MIKNAQMEKSDLTLSTYVQYVEDLKFGSMMREDLLGFREKKLLNFSWIVWSPIFFVKKVYSRTFKNLDDVIWEARKQLSTYRNIMRILDCVKKSEPKKDFGKEKRNCSDFSEEM